MGEWAQLKGGPPARGGLERGHWYRVLEIVKDGKVRVMGPNAGGIILDTPSIRIIDHDPNTITRVPGTGFQAIKPGQHPPMLTFYGVCPKGHRLDPLPLTDAEAQCPLCKRSYRVEDEEHF
jgi:hypothetical protein